MNTGYPQAVRRMKEQRLQMPHDPPDHVAAPVPCNKRCARPVHGVQRGCKLWFLLSPYTQLERDFSGFLEICSEEGIGHISSTLWFYPSSDLEKCPCIKVGTVSRAGVVLRCVRPVGFWLVHLSVHTALALTIPYK